MAVTAFPDEWLAQSLEGLITPELLQELRGKSDAGRTLWEALVAEKIATDAEIIDEMYKPEKAIDKLLEGMGDEEVLTTLRDTAAPEELNVSEADASQKPVVRLVDMIISEGILSRASDIHVEPEEGGVAVRYRIDGVLRQVLENSRPARP